MTEESAKPPLILHIASEYAYPDRPPPTTQAVKRLIDRMTDHPQIVITLMRDSNPFKTDWRDLGSNDGRRTIVYTYFAPRWGIGMFACQWVVARRIGRFLKSEGHRPDIVHAHRFTFEGISAWMLARQLKARLFFSIRGEVESKVFRAKPTYRWLFRKMAADADRIYYVSAWFRRRFETYTGADPGRTRLLPNFVFNARRTIPAGTYQNRIISPVSLRAIDRKGLPELMAAFSKVAPSLDGITLEVIGEGPPEAYERMRALINKHDLADRVVLRPPMENAALLEYMTQSLAVAMPSHNETFGMVYPEALFAGTPILYSKGTGIDGYLDGLKVGVAVEPGDVAEIAEGLSLLVRDNQRFRAEIRTNAPSLYERFSPSGIEARYRADIEEVIGTD